MRFPSSTLSEFARRVLLFFMSHLLACYNTRAKDTNMKFWDWLGSLHVASHNFTNKPSRKYYRWWRHYRTCSWIDLVRYSWNLRVSFRILFSWPSVMIPTRSWRLNLCFIWFFYQNSLSLNQFGLDGCTALGQCISTLSSLISLEYVRKEDTSNKIVSYSNSINFGKTLMSWSLCTPMWAILSTYLLQIWRTSKNYSLHGNDFGDEGMEAIAVGLHGHPSIQILE